LGGGGGGGVLSGKRGDAGQPMPPEQPHHEAKQLSVLGRGNGDAETLCARTHRQRLLGTGGSAWSAVRHDHEAVAARWTCVVDLGECVVSGVNLK
jgi:hypothetical protein